MDEDECEVEISVSYVPMAWSWRSFVHNLFISASEAATVGADFLETVAAQFGCASEKERLDKEKTDVAVEAKRMLAALDDL